MTVPRRGKAIRNYVLANVSDHPRDISRETEKHLGVSRQAVNRHMRVLVRDGLLSATGKTRARQYYLTPLVATSFRLAVTPRLEEHIAWRETISPLLSDVADNVIQICQHGFEEMVNNVVSHSDGQTLTIEITRTAVRVEVTVSDDGVGIFNNIQKTFGYDDPRHALLELSKGKVTSDPDRHTGEGVFFTSRMFDEFNILSGELFFSRRNDHDDWLIEVEDLTFTSTGTRVFMAIHPQATQTSKEIFDRFASGEDWSFSKTHVPIILARYEKEQLLSRSQARRVLARFERFREVILDFKGVEQIGQAFADEIFRVFHREHPEIQILTLFANADVQQVISRVTMGANEFEQLS